MLYRQLSDSENHVKVSEEQKRRKKVKISAESIRDGGEWDFRSGSYWNTRGDYIICSLIACSIYNIHYT